MDGHPFLYRTYQRKVEAVLKEAGLNLAREDLVAPARHAGFGEGEGIVVRRALPVQLNADGRELRFHTMALSVGEALEQAGITLAPEDIVLKNGLLSFQEEALREPWPRSAEGASFPAFPLLQIGQPALQASLPPLGTTELVVKRAVPIHILDDGLPLTILTTESLLGEGLEAQGIELSPGDLVLPPPDTPVSAGLQVRIQRARGVSLEVDKTKLELRTRARTVSSLLEEQGISLGPLDKVEPGLASEIEEGMAIRVVRIREQTLLQEEAIAYPVEYHPDPELEIDMRRTLQEGSRGLRKWETYIRYEDGREVESYVVQEWLEAEPQPLVIAYGTRIVERDLETPEGTLRYWRKMRLFATSYDASHGGKSREDPRYGYTSTGLWAERGVVAVDPRVIPLYTHLYIPEYGLALAGDTGGAVRGSVIDLAFAEEETGQWKARWTEVYWLSPPPPPSQIRWILPD